jgi:hypothetical protein
VEREHFERKQEYSLYDGVRGKGDLIIGAHPFDTLQTELNGYVQQ